MASMQPAFVTGRPASYERFSTLPGPSREYDLRRRMGPFPLGSAFPPERINQAQLAAYPAPTPQMHYRRITGTHPQYPYSYEHPGTMTSTYYPATLSGPYGLATSADSVD